MASRRKSTGTSLDSILTLSAIQSIAGSTYFKRGEDYYRKGHVADLTEYQGEISAEVVGTESYTVKLWSEGDDIGYSCTCPLGYDEAFCKHCVATALAWLHKKEQGATGRATTSGNEADDIATSLRKMEKEELVDIIMKQAMDDADFRHILKVKVVKKSGGQVDKKEYKKVITAATRVDDFIDYHNAPRFARGIRKIIETLASLLGSQAEAATVMELVEYAMERVRKALENADDSDGYISGTLSELQDLHFDACSIARPDPADLAEKLFHLELASDWDGFYGAYKVYGKLLGEKGRKHYRALAESEWKKLKPLGPGSREGYAPRRFRIMTMMKSFAEESGDIEALVAVLQKDLSMDHHYIAIARLYIDAGMHDKGLEWGEKGLKAFPSHPDPHLLNLLKEEYKRRKMYDRMMEIAWKEFSETPGLESYKMLKSYTDTAKQWPAWRKKALEFLDKQKKNPKPVWEGISAVLKHSLFVEIFLWEGDDEAAWQAAMSGGCSEHLWVQLAAVRARNYPEDALAVYMEQVERMHTLGRDYELLVEMIQNIGKIMADLKRTEEFEHYLEATRTTWKRRRTFMALLDKAFPRGSSAAPKPVQTSRRRGRPSRW